MDIRRLIIIFIALYIGTFPLCARNVLHGNVVNESNEALLGATVRVLCSDSVFVSGTITDDVGKFRIEGLEAGEYILAVSCVGYINLFLSFEMPEEEYTLPTTVLKTDNVILEEVTITGSSFIQKKDHLLVLPNKTQMKHAFSGYDLLYNLMIPGLTIDRGKKTVTSMTGNATLYIKRG
ncbi:MAG: carboxypeptidase-like regulatory domain-containing protein [Bacteroides pyogenes]|uniref:carboxypeptidase-like regulatory domain-containing protein n=1 Tax=Bacteroides pyogenes TaxID=310300 RepID=UPI002431A74F|nr:carboxypeptidase-like regulatory domain-containing protein [Bacteroides pyogenes]MCI7070738.1 carboxypeptidase-like regulatory domain-containing protein [Bacteroides pyogenes]